MINFSVLKACPFIAFVCYTAFVGVDLNSIKVIKQAVSAKLGDRSVFIDNDLSKKTLLSLEKLETSHDNLYMWTMPTKDQQKQKSRDFKITIY